MYRSMLIVPLAIFLASCATDGARYQIGESTSSNPILKAQGIYKTEVAALGRLGELDSPLRAISTPLPAYPVELRMANIEGPIKVRFYIEADGSVGNPVVLGNPHPALASITLETLKYWRFGPITRGGRPVRVEVEQHFMFAMQ
ncbi:MAG: hypothetical protein CMK78_11970 [Pseudomonadales bacterium]|nr:hypothetical protein [Pseudomonadales bacterium]|tara:strand:- start:39 stop:470 length:432 start_codon:yes stop_codon:yes gene_type:complete